ncbi:MAG: preprotein translocase subunit YajC [Treponema sp.]|nr:preprotein translocase subunit YajC [Treponema sp.]
MSFIPFLQAATGTAPSASTSGSLISTLVPFLLIIVIFYFFLIRPQNKKQKETEKMLNALKKGDKVITIGGIHGVISSVKENTVVLKVDGDVKIEFNRSAISTKELSDAEKAKIAEEKAAKKNAKKEKKSLKETADEDKTLTEEVSKDASEESKKDSEEENK